MNLRHSFNIHLLSLHTETLCRRQRGRLRMSCHLDMWETPATMKDDLYVCVERTGLTEGTKMAAGGFGRLDLAACGTTQIFQMTQYLPPSRGRQHLWMRRIPLSSFFFFFNQRADRTLGLGLRGQPSKKTYNIFWNSLLFFFFWSPFSFASWCLDCFNSQCQAGSVAEVNAEGEDGKKKNHSNMILLWVMLVKYLR